MKLYDLVYDLLVTYPAMRDSDRLLIWNVWGKSGYLQEIQGVKWGSGEVVKQKIITRESFMKATSPESIRRCRQKIQEKYPELRSSKKIQKEKDKIAKEKGTFIYREEV